MPQPVHYVPIVTTLVSTAFAVRLWRHWRSKPQAIYLFWWFLGLVTYAVGTLTESLTTLFGWNELTFRAWYVAGALLGGAPLAQGSVYLLLPRRTAHVLTAALIAVVAIGSACVFLSPILPEAVDPTRLTGRVLAWQWVRGFSPFVNLYAVLFLVGGAIWSAVRYARQRGTGARVWGNVAIAVGAILPGIGGTFTRFGHVEVLYVTELVGVCFVWLGYRAIARDRTPTIHAPQASSAQPTASD